MREVDAAVADMLGGPRADVTVVVPTHLGAGRIEQCLRSLAEQTLDQGRYEVVVVRNGPDDGTDDAVRRCASRHPSLQVRLIVGATLGAARARNVGLAAADGRYVTFVDDCDRVSAEYLDAMLRHCGPTTISVALTADETAMGDPPTFQSAGHRYATVVITSPGQLPAAMVRSAGKVMPTVLARAIGFDGALRDGGEGEFWVRLMALAPMELALCPIADHAVYYRRPGQAARSELDVSYDADVTPHLEVISTLESGFGMSADLDQLVRYLVADQVAPINAYLRDRLSEHGAVVADIRARGIRSVPMHLMNAGLARDLAVLYVALPFADTSALVAARRIRERGVVVDVVSNNMSKLKKKDFTAEPVWAEYVDTVTELRAYPVSAWWPAVLDFCRKALAAVEAAEANKGPYRSVYSRAMWPTSHVFGAMLKIRNPQIHWIAEFSDPILFGIRNERRQSSGVADPEVLATFRDALSAKGLPSPNDDNMYFWIESLVYGLADEIMFTNAHQQKYMFGHFDEPALVARANAHAVVAEHPTLDRSFYDAQPSTYPLDPGFVHIGYFGVFYATRGLAEVTSALSSLPPATRSRLKLHVFTPEPAKLATEIAAAGLVDVVIPNEYVGYLEFLNLTTRFDVLLVNDFRTADTRVINPYVPAKYADYAGSGAAIWGIVEPGSVLSSRPLHYESILGDVQGARDVLTVIAAGKGCPTTLSPASSGAYEEGIG